MENTPTPLHPVATTQAGELPELPEPLEIDWPQLHSAALGCGVEDRGLHDRYECAEYGWQEGMGSAASRVPDAIYDRDAVLAIQREAFEAGKRAAIENRASHSAELDLRSLKEQAAAWKAVFKVLDEVTNCAWLDTGVSNMTTKELAVCAIRNLAAQAANPPHSTAADAVPVAWLYEWETGSTITQGEKPLDPASESYFDMISDRAIAIPLYTHPSPTTAPIVQQGSYLNIFEVFDKYNAGEMSESEVIVAILSNPFPEFAKQAITAPAATTPAASESIAARKEFHTLALAVRSADEVEKFAAIAKLADYCTAHTAAQVAALQRENANLAYELNMALSGGSPAALVVANKPAEPVEPEFSIDPDGELCLDWNVGDAVLSVSIGGSGKIAWVADSGGKTVSGSKKFGKPAA